MIVARLTHRALTKKSICRNHHRLRGWLSMKFSPMDGPRRLLCSGISSDSYSPSRHCDSTEPSDRLSPLSRPREHRIAASEIRFALRIKVLSSTSNASLFAITALLWTMTTGPHGYRIGHINDAVAETGETTPIAIHRSRLAVCHLQSLSDPQGAGTKRPFWIACWKATQADRCRSSGR